MKGLLQLVVLTAICISACATGLSAYTINKERQSVRCTDPAHLKVQQASIAGKSYILPRVLLCAKDTCECKCDTTTGTCAPCRQLGTYYPCPTSWCRCRTQGACIVTSYCGADGAGNQNMGSYCFLTS